MPCVAYARRFACCARCAAALRRMLCPLRTLLPFRVSRALRLRCVRVRVPRPLSVLCGVTCRAAFRYFRIFPNKGRCVTSPALRGDLPLKRCLHNPWSAPFSQNALRALPEERAFRCYIAPIFRKNQEIAERAQGLDEETRGLHQGYGGTSGMQKRRSQRMRKAAPEIQGVRP